MDESMTVETELLLTDVDVDGAIGETLHDASGGTTRADFLKRFTVGASGIALAGALAPVTAFGAERRSLEQDISILNFALTLEYLEQDFYRQAVRFGKLNRTLTNFARVVAAHETSHVKALDGTIRKLGGTPVARPRFNFRGTNRSNGTFMATAQALEETGVAAYLGQVKRFENRDLLQAAAQIVTVEARHAAWMRQLRGFLPAPFDFDKVRNMDNTLRVVGNTNFIVS